VGVFNDNMAGLRNLQPAALLLFCITKTVAADDRVVVNDDTLTEERANRDARVDRWAFADSDVSIDRDVGMNANAFDDLDVTVREGS